MIGKVVPADITGLGYILDESIGSFLFRKSYNEFLGQPYSENHTMSFCSFNCMKLQTMVPQQPVIMPEAIVCNSHMAKPRRHGLTL